MLLAVSCVSFRADCINYFIACSGLSCGRSVIPMKIRLSRMLRLWRSSMVSFIVLFSFEMVFIWVVSVLTVSLSSLFSPCKVLICDWVYLRLVFSYFMSA